MNDKPTLEKAVGIAGSFLSAVGSRILIPVVKTVVTVVTEAVSIVGETVEKINTPTTTQDKDKSEENK